MRTESNHLGRCLHLQVPFLEILVCDPARTMSATIVFPFRLGTANAREGLPRIQFTSATVIRVRRMSANDVRHSAAVSWSVRTLAVDELNIRCVAV